jgi:hypothetical protein
MAECSLALYLHKYKPLSLALRYHLRVPKWANRARTNKREKDISVAGT